MTPHIFYVRTHALCMRPQMFGGIRVNRLTIIDENWSLNINEENLIKSVKLLCKYIHSTVFFSCHSGRVQCCYLRCSDINLVAKMKWKGGWTYPAKTTPTNFASLRTASQSPTPNTCSVSRNITPTGKYLEQKNSQKIKGLIKRMFQIYFKWTVKSGSCCPM